MKRILIVIASLLFACPVIARPISRDDAIKTAFSFISQEKNIKIKDVSIVYTQKLKHFEHNAFYVCNAGENTFVIVSGDDIALPILAYSFENTFKNEIPENVKGFFDDWADEIDYALMYGSDNARTNTQASRTQLQTTTLPNSVAPLLTTTWRQGAPYNGMCPYDDTVISSYQNHVPVGCVAVAMAQVINYWEYPTNPRGKHSYTSSYGNLTVDFDNASYDYSLMPNVLTNSSPTANILEVQKLLYHCGVAVDMDYGATGSGAYDISIRSALINYFGYSPQIGCANKSSYNSSTWINMLKEELASGRPVIYSGRTDDNSGGHQFVCDGYNTNDLFHFNFGWGGYGDGYYSLNAVNPADGHHYNTNQKALFGVEPGDNTNIYLSQLSGSSAYTISDTVEFYDLKSTNSYLFPYNHSHSHRSVFKPADSRKQLVLEPITNSTQYIKVYDGHNYNSDSLILNIGDSFPDIADSQFYSTNHAFTIWDNQYFASFGFRIYVDNQCYPVSNISAVFESDTTFASGSGEGIQIIPALYDGYNPDCNCAIDNRVRLTWQENGSAESWQITYGYEGFAIGQRPITTLYDTTMLIRYLEQNTSYDFYVRAVCDDSNYSPWMKHTFFYSNEFIDSSLCIPVSNITVSVVQDTIWGEPTAGEYGPIEVELLDGYDPLCNCAIQESVVLSWADNNNAIDWQVEYGPAGFEIGNGTRLLSSDTNLHLLNLSHNTAYDFYVRSRCDLNTFSAWTLHPFVYCDIVRNITNISVCDEYMWKGNMYTSSAIVADTIVSSTGCDSILLLNLTINHSSTRDTFVAVCDEFEWNGMTYLSDMDTLYETAVNSVGCDSSTILHLTVNQSVITYDTVVVTIMDLPLVIFNDTLIDGGDYIFSSYTINGCDSIVHLHLKIDSTIYPWQLQQWHNVVTTQPEGYQIGNDGNVYIYSNEGLAWLISVCNGYNGAASLGYSVNSINLMADVDMSEYAWTPLELFNNFYGNNHTITGLSISDSSSNVGFIKNIYSSYRCQDVILNNCSIFNFHPYGYTGCITGTNAGTIINCGVSGTVTSVANNTGGIVGYNRGTLANCYSVADISGKQYVGGAIGSSHYNQSTILNCYAASNITYNNPYTYSPPYAGAFIGAANENNNTDFIAYWYQRDTATVGCGNNVAGFSPFVISLEIDTIITITDDWNNVIGYQTIYDTVLNLVTPTSIGGQSVFTLVDALNAWVDSNNSNGQYRRWTNDTDNINQGFPVFDITRYSVSLTCDSSMGSVSGDGIYVENSQITISANASNCYHFTQWSDGNTNSTRTITVTQGTSLTAIFAPDAPAVGSVSATECDQYSWKGNTYTTNGTYTFDTLTALGCDSIVSLSLTINHSDLTGSISITACNEYNWNGNSYYNSGVYTYSTTTTQGCDSLATLNLTIGNEIVNIDSAVTCDYYVWNGLSYNNSGVYTDTLSTLYGCDSILVLNLTLYHSDTVGSETIVACDSYTWKGNTYSGSGIYTFDSLTTNGCDSTVTLFLTINHSDLTGAENITTCDDIYAWNGTTYNSSGTYTHNTTTSAGCDSLVTLTLVLGDSFLINDTATACDSYTWNGTVYNSSGNYEKNYSTLLGCDSTLTLHLTINHSVTNDITVSACDSMIWNGITYIESGEYAFEMETTEGCDSIVTLDLTVNHPINTSTTEIACDSLDWYGNKYYESGTYYRNMLDDNGCNQTDTIYLTINHSTDTNYTIIIKDTILPYNFNGVEITESGEYTIRLTNADGCDSNVHLYVIVETVNIEIADGSNDISIFPNPTNGMVTVSSNQAISLIEIFDAVGRMVRSENDANSIDLSGLPNGAYTMKIVTPESQRIRKIIKH